MAKHANKKAVNTPQSAEEFAKRVSFKNCKKSIDSISIKSIKPKDVNFSTPQSMEEFNSRMAF